MCWGLGWEPNSHPREEKEKWIRNQQSWEQVLSHSYSRTVNTYCSFLSPCLLISKALSALRSRPPPPPQYWGHNILLFSPGHLIPWCEPPCSSQSPQTSGRTQGSPISQQHMARNQPPTQPGKVWWQSATWQSLWVRGLSSRHGTWDTSRKAIGGGEGSRGFQMLVWRMKRYMLI